MRLIMLFEDMEIWRIKEGPHKQVMEAMEVYLGQCFFYFFYKHIVTFFFFLTKISRIFQFKG